MIRNKGILLLDVGGTFIKCSDGRSVPVDSDGGRNSVVSSLREAVGDPEAYSRIATAIPGPFDYGNGTFLMKHKFASVYGESFASLVGGNPDTFRFIHDVNCMLLGEMRYGNGRGFNRVAMVTLGTGLGFSMSIDGEILKNEAGSPAISIFNKPFREGTLEDYASKRGILKLYGKHLNLPAGFAVKQVADLASTGDRDAAAAFAEAGSIIGEGIAPILKEYGIECLLLGGQISRSHALFSGPLSDRLGGIATLKVVLPVSDFDNATFNGLKALI